MNADVHSTNMTDLLEKVKAGQEITLTENGEPVATITPTSKKEKKGRLLGALKGQIWIADDFDDPLPDDFAFPWGLAEE